MSVCWSCGAPNEEENRFCVRCGVALHQPGQQGSSSGDRWNMPPSIPPQGNGGYAYGQQPGPVAPNYNDTYAPVVPCPQDGAQRLRGLAASSLMGTLALFSFLQLAAGVLSALWSALRLGQGGIGAAFTILGSLIGMIPLLLLALGIGALYRSARVRPEGPLSSGGMSMIRAGVIIQMVIGLLYVVFLLVVGILLILGNVEIPPSLRPNIDMDAFELSGMDWGMVSQILGMGMAFGAVLAGGMLAAVYIVALRFVGSLARSLSTGFLQIKCATATMVFLYILGGFSALGALGSLAGGFASFLSGAVGTAWFFLAAAAVQKARDIVRSAGY